jgi:hypothetical protein
LLSSLLPAQAFWQSREGNKYQYGLAAGAVHSVRLDRRRDQFWLADGSDPTADVLVINRCHTINANGVANQAISTCADNANVGGNPNRKQRIAGPRRRRRSGLLSQTHAAR